LNHFYPGTSVFSFGTAGCNLGCRFCQNWSISKAQEHDRLNDWAFPDAVAEAAVRAGCRSIAFTYNEPAIFAEYAIDCARAAHERNIKTVAVTSGYIMPEARRDFFAHIDATNVDLKAFTDRFYRKLCFAELVPVLDTLRWIKQETAVWLEVTTLLIPDHNDSEDEVARLCDWLVNNLGPDVPLHFTAFHPAFKMTHVPPTPAATIRRARDRALTAGIRHVYPGNLPDVEGQSTSCASCGKLLIKRSGYHLGTWNLDTTGTCRFCGTRLAGHFDAEPGNWEMRRRRSYI